MNLSKATKTITALDYAAGTAAREGAGLDMQGFESVLMIVKLGTVAAGEAAYIKAQQSDDDGVADAYSDLEGTKIAIASTDSDTIKQIDLVKPQKRYVRLYVYKDGANSVGESAVYLQYEPKTLPTTQETETTSETHISVDEGTA